MSNNKNKNKGKNKQQLNQPVIENNKKEKAAALKYDGTNTPKLIAKGEGQIAKEIISIAQKNDVHIHYDPLLLDVLCRLEMGDEIPETLYLVVAKIIAFAYYLQGKHPQTRTNKKAGSKLCLSDKSKQINPPKIDS